MVDGLGRLMDSDGLGLARPRMHSDGTAVITAGRRAPARGVAVRAAFTGQSPAGRNWSDWRAGAAGRRDSDRASFSSRRCARFSSRRCARLGVPSPRGCGSDRCSLEPEAPRMDKGSISRKCSRKYGSGIGAGNTGPKNIGAGNAGPAMTRAASRRRRP